MNAKERENLIEVFVPLDFITFPKTQLQISITVVGGYNANLTPCLTYSYWAGGITAIGRRVEENEFWSFELICLGEDIIWKRNNYSWLDLEDVTPKPLTEIQIRAILKYIRKRKSIKLLF